MAKYRIVAITSKNDLGESETVFRIEKRLGWIKFGAWVNASILCHYYTHNYNKPPYRGALLINRYWRFESLETAERVICHLKKPVKHKYKGNHITSAFDDDTLEPVYINWSFYRTWDGKPCYEFGKTIKQLERAIDERIITKTVVHVG
jgi:hypothetical protein